MKVILYMIHEMRMRMNIISPITLKGNTEHNIGKMDKEYLYHSITEKVRFIVMLTAMNSSNNRDLSLYLSVMTHFSFSEFFPPQSWLLSRVHSCCYTKIKNIWLWTMFKKKNKKSGSWIETLNTWWIIWYNLKTGVVSNCSLETTRKKKCL